MLVLATAASSTMAPCRLPVRDGASMICKYFGILETLNREIQAGSNAKSAYRHGDMQ